MSKDFRYFEVRTIYEKQMYSIFKLKEIKLKIV